MGTRARYFTATGLILLAFSWLVDWGEPYFSYAAFVVTAIGLYKLNKAIPSSSEDTHTNEQDEV